MNPLNGRLQHVLDEIDERNAVDPRPWLIRGETGPKELLAGRVAYGWVWVLESDPRDEQLIAARGHHLRRWTYPRTDFPDGRAGYLRWRTAAKIAHGAEVGALMIENGYSGDEADRASSLIRKERLGTDAMTQTHEDALCLVFIESQFDQTTDLVGEEHMVEVVAKTLKKMSPGAIELAAGIPVSDQARLIIGAAIARGNA